MSNALDRVKQEAIESITPSVGEYIGTTPRSSEPAQPTPPKLPDLPDPGTVEGPDMPPTPDVEVADVVGQPSPVINPSIINPPSVEESTAIYNLPPTPGTPESGLTFLPPEEEPSWVGLARGLQQSQYTLQIPDFTSNWLDSLTTGDVSLTQPAFDSTARDVSRNVSLWQRFLFGPDGTLASDGQVDQVQLGPLTVPDEGLLGTPLYGLRLGFNLAMAMYADVRRSRQSVINYDRLFGGPNAEASLFNSPERREEVYNQLSPSPDRNITNLEAAITGEVQDYNFLSIRDLNGTNNTFGIYTEDEVRGWNTTGADELRERFRENFEERQRFRRLIGFPRTFLLGPLANPQIFNLEVGQSEADQNETRAWQNLYGRILEIPYAVVDSFRMGLSIATGNDISVTGKLFYAGALDAINPLDPFNASDMYRMWRISRLARGGTQRAAVDFTITSKPTTQQVNFDFNRAVEEMKFDELTDAEFLRVVDRLGQEPGNLGQAVRRNPELRERLTRLTNIQGELVRLQARFDRAVDAGDFIAANNLNSKIKDLRSQLGGLTAATGDVSGATQTGAIVDELSRLAEDMLGSGYSSLSRRVDVDAMPQVGGTRRLWTPEQRANFRRYLGQRIDFVLRQLDDLNAANKIALLTADERKLRLEWLRGLTLESLDQLNNTSSRLAKLHLARAGADILRSFLDNPSLLRNRDDIVDDLLERLSRALPEPQPTSLADEGVTTIETTAVTVPDTPTKPKPKPREVRDLGESIDEKISKVEARLDELNESSWKGTISDAEREELRRLDDTLRDLQYRKDLQLAKTGESLPDGLSTAANLAENGDLVDVDPVTIQLTDQTDKLDETAVSLQKVADDAKQNKPTKREADINRDAATVRAEVSTNPAVTKSNTQQKYKEIADLLSSTQNLTSKRLKDIAKEYKVAGYSKYRKKADLRQFLTDYFTEKSKRTGLSATTPTEPIKLRRGTTSTEPDFIPPGKKPKRSTQPKPAEPQPAWMVKPTTDNVIVFDYVKQDHDPTVLAQVFSAVRAATDYGVIQMKEALTYVPPVVLDTINQFRSEGFTLWNATEAIDPKLYPNWNYEAGGTNGFFMGPSKLMVSVPSPMTIAHETIHGRFYLERVGKFLLDPDTLGFTKQANATLEGFFPWLRKTEAYKNSFNDATTRVKEWLASVRSGVTPEPKTFIKLIQDKAQDAGRKYTDPAIKYSEELRTSSAVSLAIADAFAYEVTGTALNIDNPIKHAYEIKMQQGINYLDSDPFFSYFFEEELITYTTQGYPSVLESVLLGQTFDPAGIEEQLRKVRIREGLEPMTPSPVTPRPTTAAPTPTQPVTPTPTPKPSPTTPTPVTPEPTPSPTPKPTTVSRPTPVPNKKLGALSGASLEHLSNTLVGHKTPGKKPSALGIRAGLIDSAGNPTAEGRIILDNDQFLQSDFTRMVIVSRLTEGNDEVARDSKIMHEFWNAMVAAEGDAAEVLAQELMSTGISDINKAKRRARQVLTLHEEILGPSVIESTKQKGVKIFKVKEVSREAVAPVALYNSAIRTADEAGNLFTSDTLATHSESWVPLFGIKDERLYPLYNLIDRPDLFELELAVAPFQIKWRVTNEQGERTPVVLLQKLYEPPGSTKPTPRPEPTPTVPTPTPTVPSPTPTTAAPTPQLSSMEEELAKLEARHDKALAAGRLDAASIIDRRIESLKNKMFRQSKADKWAEDTMQQLGPQSVELLGSSSSVSNLAASTNYQYTQADLERVNIYNTSFLGFKPGAKINFDRFKRAFQYVPRSLFDAINWSKVTLYHGLDLGAIKTRTRYSDSWAGLTVGRANGEAHVFIKPEAFDSAVLTHELLHAHFGQIRDTAPDIQLKLVTRELDNPELVSYPGYSTERVAKESQRIFDDLSKVMSEIDNTGREVDRGLTFNGLIELGNAIFDDLDYRMFTAFVEDMPESYAEDYQIWLAEVMMFQSYQKALTDLGLVSDTEDFLKFFVDLSEVSVSQSAAQSVMGLAALEELLAYRLTWDPGHFDIMIGNERSLTPDEFYVTATTRRSRDSTPIRRGYSETGEPGSGVRTGGAPGGYDERYPIDSESQLLSRFGAENEFGPGLYTTSDFQRAEWYGQAPTRLNRTGGTPQGDPWVDTYTIDPRANIAHHSDVFPDYDKFHRAGRFDELAAINRKALSEGVDVIDTGAEDYVILNPNVVMDVSRTAVDSLETPFKMRIAEYNARLSSELPTIETRLSLARQGLREVGQHYEDILVRARQTFSDEARTQFNRLTDLSTQVKDRAKQGRRSMVEAVENLIEDVTKCL